MEAGIAYDPRPHPEKQAANAAGEGRAGHKSSPRRGVMRGALDTARGVLLRGLVLGIALNVLVTWGYSQVAAPGNTPSPPLAWATQSAQEPPAGPGNGTSDVPLQPAN